MLLGAVVLVVLINQHQRTAQPLDFGRPYKIHEILLILLS